MISAIDNTLLSGAAPSTSASTGSATTFDAAMIAAQKAKAKEEAHQSDMDSIREKGFTDWVRDTRIEKLKEELRKKIMAGMGLDEDSLSKMESVVQQVLRQKIEEAVQQQLDQAMQEEEKAKTGQQQTAQATTTQTSTGQSGKKDQDGISCPVIPALMGAGGVSLF